MKPPLRRASRASAFTLIELLAVMGLIVVLVGGLALALAGRGGDGAALANAQTLVASLAGAARAQAALHQEPARLVVHAEKPTAEDGGAPNYLRVLQVVRHETQSDGSTLWIAAGDPVTLPAPVCVVPPPPVPADHLRLSSDETWNNDPASGAVSTLATQAGGFSWRAHTTSSVTRFFGAVGRSGRIHLLEFAPDGTVSAPDAAPVTIALGTALLAGEAVPQFNNPHAVRTVVIRRTGAVSFADDRTGL